MIRLSPLQIAGLVLVLMVIGLTGWRIHAYGAARYEAGKASVKAEWDESIRRGEVELERIRKTSATATVKTEYVYMDRVKTIREKGNDIIRNVPVFVPVGSCDLPGGFRLLHDASAQDQPVPEAAGISDAAPVPAQDAATTVAGNYSTCHETAQRLVSLQDWVAAQCKANPPPEGCGQ